MSMAAELWSAQCEIDTDRAAIGDDVVLRDLAERLPLHTIREDLLPQ
jgi:hypothetical protein